MSIVHFSMTAVLAILALKKNILALRAILRDISAYLLLW